MERRIRVIIAALAVRLAIAPFFMHAGDVGTIYESSRLILEGGNLYSFVYEQTLQLQHATGLPLFFEGYAYHPILIYFFLPFYWLFTVMAGSSPVFVGGHFPTLPVLIYPWAPLAILMLKIPIIIADVAVVYLLASFSIRKAEVYAFCPYIIFISVVWGMFDAIVGVFLLLSYLAFLKNSYVISGFAYGLSLVKLYTIVLLPLFIIRLLGRWRELGEFLLGILVTLIPVAYYLMISPGAFWNVLVIFQGSRVMGGVNMYNFIWIVQDVHFNLQLSTYVSILLIVSLIYVLLRFGWKLPLLESILAVMLTSFLLGRVMNEQFLVSIFPLLLLCRRCDHRLWIPPFIFIFLRSPFYYFAVPVLWASPYFYDFYFQLDAVWRQLQTEGYLMIPIYGVGIMFSLFIFWNLLQVVKAPGAASFELSLSRVFSRAVRIRRR
jgi:hypothetical protein